MALGIQVLSPGVSGHPALEAVVSLVRCAGDTDATTVVLHFSLSLKPNAKLCTTYYQA
jgi:hypothetical protein